MVGHGRPWSTMVDHQRTRLFITGAGATPKPAHHRNCVAHHALCARKTYKKQCFSIFSEQPRPRRDTQSENSRRPQRGTGERPQTDPARPPRSTTATQRGGPRGGGQLLARSRSVPPHPQPPPNRTNTARKQPEPKRPLEQKGAPAGPGPTTKKWKKTPPTQKTTQLPPKSGRTDGRGPRRAGRKARTPRGGRIGRPNTKVQGRPNGEHKPRTPPPEGAATHPRGKRRGGASSTRGRAEPPPTKTQTRSWRGAARTAHQRRPHIPNGRGQQKKWPRVRSEEQQHAQP